MNGPERGGNQSKRKNISSPKVSRRVPTAVSPPPFLGGRGGGGGGCVYGVYGKKEKKGHGKPKLRDN